MPEIAIIDVGTIGSMVGAYLQCANIQVTLFKQHEQVNAIRKNGIIIGYSNGEIVRMGLSHGMRKSYNSTIVDIVHLVAGTREFSTVADLRSRVRKALV